MVKPSKKQQQSGQRTLDTFLAAAAATTGSVATKRKNEEKNNNNDEDEHQVATVTIETVTTSKKLKTDEKEEAGSSSGSAKLLTPEQKKMISSKRATAQLKLLSHTLPLIDPDSIGPSWFNEILATEFKKPYFKQLNDFYLQAVSRGATVYPPRNQIFSWTKYCEVRDVKVVVLGQDPYHGPRQAHGLCFSVQKGVAVPPSLLNMYKELVEDPGVEAFQSVPSHGCLVGWAEQGVLLLNAVLTVEASKPNSHKDKGWEHLTTAVVKWISNNLRDVVFLLWGSFAQKMGSVVDKKRHVVLSCAHPSPLSAHRGFFGCRHFSKCNEELRKRGRGEIEWGRLP